MRRTVIALTAAIVAAAGLVPANPASAIPPPPTLLCANDFSTGNLTGWSQTSSSWTVADGAYQQTATRINTTSWYEAEWFAHSATARVKLVDASRRSSFVAFHIGVRDAKTSYRLVLQARSVVQLQYVNAGAVTVLASQALPVTAGTWYTIHMGTPSQRQLFAQIDGAWLFGGYVNMPAGGHYLGGVAFTASYTAGAFDDLSVIQYGPSTEPRCPTTPS